MEVLKQHFDYLNQKPTTQNAPLEKFLSELRTRRIKGFCVGKEILDFGCGLHFHTLNSLSGIAKSLSGFDQLFLNSETSKTPAGYTLYGSYEALPETTFDVITALAVFEHIEPSELPLVLKKLKKSLKPNGLIIGTVPTPLARPVLEFLSFKLKLIDESQIRDHKIYYNKRALKEQMYKANLELCGYQSFQFGLNSFFVARLKNEKQ